MRNKLLKWLKYWVLRRQAIFFMVKLSLPFHLSGKVLDDLENYMPTISTLGSPARRTQFTYAGSVADGVTLEFTGRPRVTAEFFAAILSKFAGQTIPGGFSMVNPTPGGLGIWMQQNSLHMNAVRLTPRHGSFIAAILVHEGYITSNLQGNAVMLHFP